MKADSAALMKNHVVGKVRDKLLKELEGCTGVMDFENSTSEDDVNDVGRSEFFSLTLACSNDVQRLCSGGVQFFFLGLQLD